MINRNGAFIWSFENKGQRLDGPDYVGTTGAEIFRHDGQPSETGRLNKIKIIITRQGDVLFHPRSGKQMEL